MKTVMACNVCKKPIAVEHEQGDRVIGFCKGCCSLCPDCGYTAVIVQPTGVKYCLHCGWDDEGEQERGV